MKGVILVTLLFWGGLFNCPGAGSEDNRPYNERHTFKVDEKKTIIMAEDGKAMADIALDGNKKGEL